jgi:hypothetical protein
MSTQIQNFYESFLTRNWTATTGDFNVSVAPTISEGIIVISPSSRTLREIVRFTATGTNAYGPFVRVSNIAHRGLGGTTAQSHTIGEKVRMNITAEHWTEMQDDIDSIVASGLPAGSLGDVMYHNGSNWGVSNFNEDLLTEDKIRTATVTLSSADILALHTTPKELLPAPGAGKINVVDEVIFSFTTGSVAYTGTGILRVLYTGDTTTNYLTNYGPAAVLTNSSYRIIGVYPNAEANTEYTLLTAGINNGVTLGTNSAFITGDGTLKVFIKYRILTL